MALDLAIEAFDGVRGVDLGPLFLIGAQAAHRLTPMQALLTTAEQLLHLTNGTMAEVRQV
ncbi:hypothetical protein [Nitrospirillum viridazoti]|uniref:hypothetical protein n=1 Tax=Nitrospirillum viridazoti TaxID=3144925 RepID=UPI0005950229